MTIGERIKYFRKEKGLTQAELAELTSLSHSSIKAYEIDARTPSRKAAKKIAELLGVNTEALLKNEDYLPNQENERLNFICSFENGTDQLVFYDSLQSLRMEIDKIEDNKVRRRVAENLNDIFNALTKYQRDFKEINQDYSIEMHWQEREHFICEFLRTVKKYLEAFEDSQFSQN